MDFNRYDISLFNSDFEPKYPDIIITGLYRLYLVHNFTN